CRRHLDGTCRSSHRPSKRRVLSSRAEKLVEVEFGGVVATRDVQFEAERRHGLEDVGEGRIGQPPGLEQHEPLPSDTGSSRELGLRPPAPFPLGPDDGAESSRRVEREWEHERLQVCTFQRTSLIVRWNVHHRKYVSAYKRIHHPLLRTGIALLAAVAAITT